MTLPVPRLRADALAVSLAAVDAALIVAIYAAAASTVVGIWQIYSGIQQRRTKIEINTYIGEIHQRAPTRSPTC